MINKIRWRIFVQLFNMLYGENVNHDFPISMYNPFLDRFFHI